MQEKDTKSISKVDTTNADTPSEIFFESKEPNSFDMEYLLFIEGPDKGLYRKGISCTDGSTKVEAL